MTRPAPQGRSRASLRSIAWAQPPSGANKSEAVVLVLVAHGEQRSPAAHWIAAAELSMPSPQEMGGIYQYTIELRGSVLLSC